MARYMTVVLDTEKEGFHNIMKDLDKVIIGSAVGDELRRLEAVEEAEDIYEVEDILCKLHY